MRIVTTEADSSTLKIYDAEGHEISLNGIRDITIILKPGKPIMATLEVLTEIDMQVVGNAVRKRLLVDPKTGEYVTVDMPE